jgi:ATP-dependent DNA helicase RecG
MYSILDSLTSVKEFTKKEVLIINNIIGENKRIIDLLFYTPRNYIQIQNTKSISDNIIGMRVKINCVVQNHAYRNYNGGKVPYKIIATSKDFDVINLMFFNYNVHFLKGFIPGQNITIEGKLESKNGSYQMTHPSMKKIENIKTNCNDIEIRPIYKQKNGIYSKDIHALIKKIFTFVHNVEEEWIGKEIASSMKFKSFQESLKMLHCIDDNSSLIDIENARKRLAMDEILYTRAISDLSKQQKDKDIHIIGNGLKREKLLSSLDFTPTDDQKNVLSDIYKDQKSQKQMIRMLQGDVGSGKTLVALMAMLNVCECGMQSVIIAPTMVLATQHYNSISKMLFGMSIEIEILTGSTTKSKKMQIEKRLIAGSIDILIGTHALLEDYVQFKSLGLIVIDEQHRFGVNQRMKLINKANCDVLMMTATPIPRTLAMLMYGNISMSTIKHKPIGRKKINTTVISNFKIDEIINRLKTSLSSENRCYWICPLIDSEIDQDEGVVNRYNNIKTILGDDKVALLHGKMKDKEKDKVMQEFSSGEKLILVSTTVIEVGINVPEANIIVIEDANKFGLSQLHQLRGRVGRGSSESSCILLYNPEQSSRTRLEILKETNDGFEISEKDMEIRGHGDVLGIQQSGNKEFIFFDATQDTDLIKNLNNVPDTKHDKNILFQIFNEYNIVNKNGF